MIRITRQVIKDIIDHARSAVPIEACGYLAGENGIIIKSYPMTNTDNSPEHFSFDPQEQFEVVRKTRSEGMEIMANYHSHPATPARPSQEDIDLSHDPDISYVIVSLAGGREDVKSFRIINSDVIIQEIEIIDK
ncbi:MAG: M67 family metallopeptidase [Chlorobi bacterium]|nr:M67 family metallopeptidase [Chlorobiota bacterium]